MDIQEQCKKYAKYWKIQESLPQLEEGKIYLREDIIKIVNDLRENQPRTFTRKYIPLSCNVSEEEKTSQDFATFTCKILQWNLLAQGLSTGKDNFVLCPNSALEWDYRKLLILEEILNSEADILCLEEVDKFWFLKNTLGSMGYQGIFFPKPESPALFTENTSGPDGCAMFYDKSKLKLHKYDLVNLQTLEGMETNQVCIIGVFSPLDEMDVKFCVAAVHLKAKSGWHDLRHSQGAFLLKYIKENYGNLPIMVCGDFNADNSEPVYDAFKSSSLNLQSVYALLSDKGEEPPYTTWKTRGSSQGNVEVCKTIDYMWSSKDRLAIRSLLSIPEPSDIDENRLPSCKYPSDHFSLAAEILIRK